MGTLKTEPARPAWICSPPPVVAALQWPADPGGRQMLVAPIDPTLADTAAFCAAYDVGLDVSANCVVVAGKREGEVRYAACVVLATTRADVNGVVRRRAGRPQGQLRPDGRRGRADRHGVRRDHADRPARRLAGPGGRAGGGHPARDRRLRRTAQQDRAARAALAELPGAEVVEGLARPAGPAA